MSNLVDEILALLSKLDANSSLVALIKDIIASVADPSASTILQDLEDVLKLLEALKGKLDTVHPAIRELVKKAL
jgi:hypothetical protein